MNLININVIDGRSCWRVKMLEMCLKSRNFSTNDRDCSVDMMYSVMWCGCDDYVVAVMIMWCGCDDYVVVINGFP